MRVAEVVLASDPFNANHDPSLSVACGVMVDGQYWHLWGAPFEENPLDGGILMVEGSMDGKVVALALLPLSGIL